MLPTSGKTESAALVQAELNGMVFRDLPAVLSGVEFASIVLIGTAHLIDFDQARHRPVEVIPIQGASPLSGMERIEHRVPGRQLPPQPAQVVKAVVPDAVQLSGRAVNHTVMAIAVEVFHTGIGPLIAGKGCEAAVLVGKIRRLDGSLPFQIAHGIVVGQQAEVQAPGVPAETVLFLHVSAVEGGMTAAVGNVGVHMHVAPKQRKRLPVHVNRFPHGHAIARRSPQGVQLDGPIRPKVRHFAFLFRKGRPVFHALPGVRFAVQNQLPAVHGIRRRPAVVQENFGRLQPDKAISLRTGGSRAVVPVPRVFDKHKEQAPLMDKNARFSRVLRCPVKNGSLAVRAERGEFHGQNALAQGEPAQHQPGIYPPSVPVRRNFRSGLLPGRRTAVVLEQRAGIFPAKVTGLPVPAEGRRVVVDHIAARFHRL